MDPINWPDIIRALLACGLTQPKIAERCKCGQSTVSDMLKGNTRDPRTTTGLLMLALAADHGIAVPVLAGRPCIDVARSTPTTNQQETRDAA